MNSMHARQLAHNIQSAIGRRDFAAAESALTQLADLAPADAWVRVQQSYVQSWQGRYRAAHAFALKAAALPPRDVETLSDVAWRLRTFNEVAALETYVRRLGDPATWPPEVLPDVAAQLTQVNRFSKARELLETAYKQRPQDAVLAVTLAQTLTYLGEFERARLLIAPVLSANPGFAEAWWQLASLPDDGKADAHAANLRAVLASGAVTQPEARASMLFALHRFLDTLKDFQGAGDALLAACALRHSDARVVAQATHAVVEGLLAWHPEPPVPARAASVQHVVPIFIVGPHRSGTTLLEQLLSAHSQVAAGGEMYDFTAAMREVADYHCKGVIDPEMVTRASHMDFEAVGRTYLESTQAKLEQRAFLTDKLPTNFFNVGFICEALPQARILHMVRDPMEVCFSNLREPFAEVNLHTYDAEAMADYYADYLRLMAHWHARFPGRILDVHYDALTRDTERVMREVSAFCGLHFEASTLSTASNASRGVATASVAQVRQAVSARRAPKWKPYAPFLKDMMHALTQRSIEFKT